MPLIVSSSGTMIKNPSDFEGMFAQRLSILNVSFGFHGLPLLTFKPDRLDLKGLDLEKMMSFTH